MSLKKKTGSVFALSLALSTAIGGGDSFFDIVMRKKIVIYDTRR